MILELKGGQLYYEVYGEGDAIVFINGFASGISNWYPVIKGLKTRYKCVLYDYIGTGGSVSYRDYNFCLDSYSSDLNALIDTIGAEKVHLVGYSMGGWVAQYFIRQWPTMVKSLVLVNTSSKIFSRQNWIISHFVDVLRDSDINVFSKLMFLSYYSQEYFEKNVENLDRIKNLTALTFAKQDKANWEQMLMSCLPFDEEVSLMDLKLPVLMVSGENDFLCPRMTALRFNDLISNIRWLEFKSVGHAIPMERHQDLRYTLINFLEELDGLVSVVSTATE